MATYCNSTGNIAENVHVHPIIGAQQCHCGWDRTAKFLEDGRAIEYIFSILVNQPPLMCCLEKFLDISYIAAATALRQGGLHIH